MELFDWPTMATGIGALAMVLIVTQFTKELPGIRKMPTQLWSYLVSIFVLFLAHLFTGQLNISNGFLILFNGMLIALAANGGFDALKKSFPQIFNK